MAGDPVDTQVRVRFSSWYVRLVMEGGSVAGEYHQLLTVPHVLVYLSLEVYKCVHALTPGLAISKIIHGALRGFHKKFLVLALQDW